MAWIKAKDLEFYFNPVGVMKKHFPKAAKRKRIIKKWESRFGMKDMTPIIEELSKRNYLFDRAPENRKENVQDL